MQYIKQFRYNSQAFMTLISPPGDSEKLRYEEDNRLTDVVRFSRF